MSINLISKTYEVVVVGGGLSGMCAAIAAARHGAKTAIVQNRSVFGGNASSEIRMHIVGASSHAAKPDLAIPLYEDFMAHCRERGFAVEHGEFGADMQVDSLNDGPVTILFDTDRP